MEKIEEILSFNVDKDYSGKRLDVFLSSVYPEFSRSYFQKLIKEGFVLSGDKKIKKPSKKVKEGEEYTIFIPEPEELKVKPENIPLKILYEDEDLAVIFKPAGMVVHPSPGHTSGTLVNALLYHFKNVSEFAGRERAGIVHRLDKDTAGLMVVAKSEYAHKELQKQFQDRKVNKKYKALVVGKPKDYEFIDLPIGRSIYDRKKMGTHSTSARPALTEYWLEFYDENSNISVVDVKIHTGRTHQIRVHLSVKGYPILNDKVYGFKLSKVKDERLREFLSDVPYHFLIAYELGFKHPRTNKELSFSLKNFSDYFQKVLDSIKREGKALSKSRED